MTEKIEVFAFDGGIGLQSSPVTSFNLVEGEVSAMREYFRDERDRELGRWRWPDNPDYVVYPHGDDQEVRVFNEKTGYVNSTGRPRGFQKPVERMTTKWRIAARAYFDAHPEKKPWHDAKHNELWELQFECRREPEVYRFAQDSTCADSTVFRPVNNPGRVFFHASSRSIRSARRIWPENKESDNEY